MKATFFVIHIYTHSWMRNSDDSASFPIFCGKARKYRAKGYIKERFLVIHKKCRLTDIQYHVACK